MLGDPVADGVARAGLVGAGGSLPSQFSDSLAVPVSLDAVQGLDVAALIEGHRWAGAVGADGRAIITYSFAGPASVYPGDPFSASAQSLSAADQAVVRDVLARIEAVAAVHFIEVADDGVSHGTLRYAYSSQPNAMGLAGYTFYPSDAEEAGNIWLGKDQAGAFWDFYRADLVLHETLHGLGLKHPFEGATVLPAEQNIIPDTVMSYSPIAGYAQGSLSSYPNEPMPADVAALQALYGAAPHNGSDTVYHLDASAWQQGFHVIWDSGGSDTLDASRLARAVQLDLAPGGRSDIGALVLATAVAPGGGTVSGAYHQTLSIADGATIENALGTAFNDVLLGNSVGNYLAGGAGDDRLFGLAGDDWLEGGAGSDWLDGGAGVDTAVYRKPFSAYEVWFEGEQVKVRDRATGDVDTLVAMERAQFADVTLGRPGIGEPVALAGVPQISDSVAA